MNLKVIDIKKVLIVMLTLFLLLSCITQAFAEVIIKVAQKDNQGIVDAITESEKAAGEDSTTIDGKVAVRSKDGNVGTATVNIFEYDSTNLEFKFFATEYKNANAKAANKSLTAFINSLKESTIPLDVQQDIMTQIQESDPDVAAVMIPLVFDSTKADIFTAYKWLSPFISTLRVVFGIGSILIIFLLIASTIVDFAYIGLPIFREKTTSEGKGGGSNTRPFGVSFEAQSTVKEIESEIGTGKYRNAYVLYLKRRALSYIVLAICILYLVAGELGGLISWLLGLASGIV